MLIIIIVEISKNNIVVWNINYFRMVYIVIDKILNMLYNINVMFI